MTRDKIPRLGLCDRGDPQLPIEHHAAALVVGDAAEGVAASLFDTQSLQESAAPSRVVVHPGYDLFMHSLAAGVEDELMSPYLEDFDALGVATKQALQRGGRKGVVRPDGPLQLGKAIPERGVGRPIGSARRHRRRREFCLPVP